MISHPPCPEGFAETVPFCTDQSACPSVVWPERVEAVNSQSGEKWGDGCANAASGVKRIVRITNPEKRFLAVRNKRACEKEAAVGLFEGIVIIMCFWWYVLVGQRSVEVTVLPPENIPLTDQRQGRLGRI